VIPNTLLLALNLAKKSRFLANATVRAFEHKTRLSPHLDEQRYAHNRGSNLSIPAASSNRVPSGHTWSRFLNPVAESVLKTRPVTDFATLWRRLIAPAAFPACGPEPLL
jgi:hypothetical protein